MNYPIKTLLLIFLSCATYLSNAQDSRNVREMRVSEGYIKPMNTSNIGITKQRLRILTIGIGNFDDKSHFEYLASYSNLNKYKKIAKRHLKSDYRECVVDTGLSDYVRKDDVVEKLKDFTNSVYSSDIILIPVLSHGAVDGNKYYLICSDTRFGEYQRTALSGDEILYYFKKMADKGAVVVVFLETCYSGAIVKDFKYTPQNNGILAIYSASKADETAKQIMLNTYFTSSIQNTFKQENKDAFTNGYLTLGSLYNQVWSSVKNQPKGWEQEPKVFFYPAIRDYPIISKKDKKIPSYLYLGAACGTNIKPTPYVNVHMGLDINHAKIEGGTSQAFTKSDEVCIYDNNGIMQNEYKYRGWTLYGRVGYNLMSILKKESPWEIVPLVGVSWNKVTGEQIGKFNSDIGESASSLMYSVNCRIAYDLSKNHKRSVFVQGTIGCDFGGKVKNLDNDYIKKWCSNRLYAEIGFVITSNLLKNN